MSNAGIFGTILKIAKSWQPQIEIKRFRWWAERRANGPLVRRHGYEDPLWRTGLLPRLKDANRIKQMRVYRPKDSWSEKKALFGQNDYIDILGEGNIHPTRIMYDVPNWLRGFKGNEFQMLLRKERILRRGLYPKQYPKKWKSMKVRMDWLWYELNYRRPVG